MAVNIIYRLVQGTPLSHAQGDSNLSLLLTNLSGSNVAINSNNTSITGSVVISGSQLTLHDYLKFQSTNVTSTVAGGFSNKYLIVSIAGVTYKIALQNATSGNGS